MVSDSSNDDLDDNEIAQKEEVEERSKLWAKEVKKRDKYTCIVCGKRSKSSDEREDRLILHSHHVYSWSDNPDLRFLYANGITLCEHCHGDFHSIYGKDGNNRYQFNQFKIVLEEMIYANKRKVISEKIESILLNQEAQEKIEELDGYQPIEDQENEDEMYQQISADHGDEPFSIESL
jgi:hypothetical protein